MSTVLTEANDGTIVVTPGAKTAFKDIFRWLAEAFAVGLIVGAISAFLVTRHFYLKELAAERQIAADALAHASSLNAALARATLEKQDISAKATQLESRIGVIQTALRAETEKLKRETTRAATLANELREERDKLSALRTDVSHYKKQESDSFFEALSVYGAAACNPALTLSSSVALASRPLGQVTVTNQLDSAKAAVPRGLPLLALSLGGIGLIVTVIYIYNRWRERPPKVYRGQL